MVKIEKDEKYFVFEVQGLHKLWALKSRLTIPIENVIKAYPNKESLNWFLGLRMPGTHIPGLITAGTYLVRDGVIFCDVSNHANSIVVELQDEHYSKLFIEVENLEESLEILSGKSTLQM